MAKQFRIPKEKIKLLAIGHGMCIATDRIMVDGAPIGYMYRDEPERECDSGWVFTAGDESPQYMDNAANHGVYDVNTVANYDPSIIEYLDTPTGSAFHRDSTSGKWIRERLVPPE